MTVWTVESDMPVIDLPGGSYFQFEAIDPDAGTAVSGVSVAEVAIFADDLGGGRITVEDVVPSWTPLEVEDVS